MTPAARVAAAIEVLDSWLSGMPAEAALTGWARSHRFAGSGDRRAIRDWVYAAIRRRRTASAAGGAETGRGLMLGLLRLTGADADEIFTGHGHAPPTLSAAERAVAPPAELSPAAQGDWPEWLWPETLRSLGERAERTLERMKDQAPVILRVNLLKAAPGEAIAALLADGIATAPHPLSDTALTVLSNARRIAGSAAYLGGLVELQDAASQAVVDLIRPEPGETVLDFCAGGGGKTLAIAARTRTRVDAHDADPRRMEGLPARAGRAGADVQILPRSEAPAGRYDLVVCDVPCSGSGSWRRDPDGKWRLAPDALDRLNATQTDILSRARHNVAPGGRLAYVTCSILLRENADIVARFLETYPDWTEIRSRAFGIEDGGDGFFVSLLARRTD